MALNKDQAQFFQHTLDMTRKQIEAINGQIEEELAKVKERLAGYKEKDRGPGLGTARQPAGSRGCWSGRGQWKVAAHGG